MFEKLLDKNVWQSYIDYKTERAHLSKKERAALLSFVENERYVEVCQRVKDVGLTYPTKKLVNKSGSNKKRVVYTFAEEENYLLKLIAFCLRDYDGYFCDNLYSFRRGGSVKRALERLTKHKNINGCYGYKADISNYFNSINSQKLCSLLDGVITDAELSNFLKQMLLAGKAYYNDELITEERGAMAGTPVSPFFANLYLHDLDARFERDGALYARYSDDVIMFAETKVELDKSVEAFKAFILNAGLKVNADKEGYFAPREAWSYLGVQYCNGVVDLSPVTKDKIKAKIRRKARSIYRWRQKKGVSDERAMTVLIKKFNKKFFEEDGGNDLTWSRWFFPLVNTDCGLKEIDSYLQDYARYVATGRFNKKNYEAANYLRLKELGYRSLVNEYYKQREC